MRGPVARLASDRPFARSGDSTGTYVFADSILRSSAFLAEVESPAIAAWHPATR